MKDLLLCVHPRGGYLGFQVTGMIEWSQVRLKVKTQKKVCLFKVEKGEIFTALKKIGDYGRAFEVVDLERGRLGHLQREVALRAH